MVEAMITRRFLSLLVGLAMVAGLVAVAPVSAQGELP